MTTLDEDSDLIERHYSKKKTLKSLDFTCKLLPTHFFFFFI